MRQQTRVPRRLLAGLVCLLAVTALPGLALAAQPTVSTLGVYFTSGMEGRSYASDPLTGEAESSSYLKVAAAMAAERMNYNSTLLFDLGNALPTGLLAGCDETDGGTVATTLRAIGYNGFVPSTREFTYGPEERDTFFRALSATGGTGTPVPVLSANFTSEKNQSPKMSPYQIYKVQAGSRTFRVGVLALNATDTAGQVPAAYLEGSTFTSKDNTGATLAWEWTNRWQELLRTTEQCDMVVVAYSGSGDGLTDLITSTTGIDLVLGGPLSATELKNADGKAVPCAGSSGPALSKTVVSFTSAGFFTVSQSGMLPLSDYENDTALTAQLATVQAEATSAALRPVGTLTGDWSDGIQYGSVHSKTADLVGRAMTWGSGAELALVSNSQLGALRLDSLFAKNAPQAQLSIRDCLRLYPSLTSELCVVELTAEQVKQLLEEGGSAYQVAEDRSVTGGGKADVLYGADYELYLGNRQGQQVRSLTVNDQAVPDGYLLRVAMEYTRLQESSLLPEEYTVLWRASTSKAWGPSGGSVATVLAEYVEYQTGQVGYVAPQTGNNWFVYAGTSSSPVTRLEFISMLYELAGSPRPTTNTAFLDVSGSNAVVWAAEMHISSGDGKGYFLPAQPVTKEQAAVMLFNYSKALELKTPTTTTTGGAAELLDYGQIATWARPAVDFTCRTGVLPGEGLRDDLFFPQEKLTREDAASAVERFGTLLGTVK